MKKTTIAFLIALFLLPLIVYAFAAPLIVQLLIPTTGVTTTAELELYEIDGVTPQTNLDWGSVSDGEYTQQSIIKNTGTTDLTLAMTTDEAYAWLVQTWDQEGIVVTAGSQVTVTWTLTLTGAPATTFSYTTTITGTETP